MVTGGNIRNIRMKATSRLFRNHPKKRFWAKPDQWPKRDGHLLSTMRSIMPVPDKASYIRGWIQMVLASNDLFSWNNKYNKYIEYNITDTFTCFFLDMHTTYSVHAGILKPWRSSLTFCCLLILSHLVPSLIWVQLTLLVPALGIRSPLPQDGAPIHRVRAHSLTGIRNNGLRSLSMKLTYCLPT